MYRDLLQLATEHVRIRIPKTKRTGTEIEDYLAADVKERYQVTPKEFIDVKALMGDTADNIPGVPGIGEKTATALIGQYGCIEEVHAHADVVKPPRASKNIVEYWDQAVMSKELATIITDVPVDYDFTNAKIDGKASLYTEEAYLLCKRLEFKNLLNRFPVDAPNNHAEESFQIVKDQKTACLLYTSYVSNAEEHQYLDSYVPKKQIGTKALSSVLVSLADSGNGLKVSTYNINYCTAGMYKNALATAGVEDANEMCIRDSLLRALFFLWICQLPSRNRHRRFLRCPLCLS